MCIAFAISCTKQSELEDIQNVSNAEVKCIDGALHFNSSTACITYMDSLMNNPLFKANFEANNNFKSLATETDNILYILSKIENEEVKNVALEDYKQFIFQEKGQLLPRVLARGYALVANPDGVFYINDVKHRVVDGNIEIYDINPDTKTRDLQVFSYLVQNADINTKLETSYAIDFAEYEGDKRKVFARAYLFKYIFYGTQAGSNVKVTRRIAVLQTHLSAQKKSMFGWNSYKTEFTIENFAYTFIVNGVEFSYGFRLIPQDVTTFDSPEVGDFYKDFKIVEKVEQGELTSFLDVSSIKVRFRALSRGTGRCGAVIDKFTGVGIPKLDPCR